MKGQIWVPSQAGLSRRVYNDMDPSEYGEVDDYNNYDNVTTTTAIIAAF